MTDREALVRAICEFPDDDTPRLIYADFLEESGESEYAAFIRAQIQLARTPPWEPFAVLCRFRRREWNEAGAPLRTALPTIAPEMGVEWHAEPFRRGLGWRLRITSLRGWGQVAPRLLEQAPVGELDLVGPATLDDWREFASGSWLGHIRTIHLIGTSPIEPLRALCESPHATNIIDIHFHQSMSAGLPELVEDLLLTPLGRNLKGLHFRVGSHSIEDLLAALASSASHPERLSLESMGVTPESVQALLQTEFCFGLKELNLSQNRLGIDSDSAYTEWPRYLPASLEVLKLSDTYLTRAVIETLSHHEGLPQLRHLDLSRNPPIKSYPMVFDAFPTVRLLELRQCLLSEYCLDWLITSKMWSGLVGLDLRENGYMNSETRLLEATLGSDFTALAMDRVFDPRVFDRESMLRLRDHFGDRWVADKESIE